MIYGSMDQKYKKAKKAMEDEFQMQQAKGMKLAPIDGEPEISEKEKINLSELMPIKDNEKVTMDLYSLRRNKRGQEKFRSEYEG